MRDLNRDIAKLSEVQDENEKNIIMQDSSKKFARLFNNIQTQDSETTIEVNFAILKLKHTIKNKNK